MPPLNFNNLTKVLFDGSQVGVSNYYITLAIQAGQQMHTYAIIPEDAKNLRDVLTKALDLFEQQFGKIPDSNQPVPSPIQITPPQTQ